MSDTQSPQPAIIPPELKKTLYDQKARLKLLKQAIGIQKKLGSDMGQIEKLEKSMEQFVDSAIEQAGEQ